MIKPKAPDELEEGEITCVMARVGDHDLEETVEGNNLGAWIGFLRRGVLYREINGEAITRETLLEAQTQPHESDFLFQKPDTGQVPQKPPPT